MKRIVSMVLSFLMVMTMLCGILSISSSASIAESEVAATSADSSGLVAATKVVASEVANGQFTVDLYIKDLSRYGFKAVYLELLYDNERVKPVVETIESSPNSYETIANATDFHSYFLSVLEDSNWSNPSIETPYQKISDKYYTCSNVAEIKYGVVCGFDLLPFGFSDAWLTKAEIEKNTCSITEDGLHIATLKFQALDGVTGTTDITLRCNNIEVALGLNSNNTFESTGSDGSGWAYAGYEDWGGKYSYSDVATVNLDESASVSPTLSVAQSASIRTIAPNGLRFVSNATGIKFSESTELGIRIYKGDSMSTTYKDVKAKVFWEKNETDGTAQYSAVIVVPEGSYTQDLTAVAYYKDADGNYHFSKSSVTRNIQQVADLNLKLSSEGTIQYSQEVLNVLKTYASASAN